MKNPLSLLSGATLGAAVMYFLDPERGARRRSLARDKALSVMTDSESAVQPAGRDLANRARGLWYGVRGKFNGNGVSDQVLKERVRAEMGRWTSHPGAINVDVYEGEVSLRGPILEHQLDGLLKAVERVPGVHTIDNRLVEHKTAEGVPALQGGDVPPALRPDPWPPSTRLLAGTAGGALMGVGLKRSGVLGNLLSMLGFAALVRAISGKRAKRLVGVDSGRRAVDIQKTINVNAPVEEVFRYWDNFENFPRFMSHINEVKPLGDGRSHWVVKGPAGSTVSWEAHVTRRVENEEIAWSSDQSATVQNAGIVHFSPNQEGGTQVDVRMTYNPPGGATGHSIAELLGYDPKSLMDKDLLRFKSLLEEGKTTAKGQQVSREELGS